VAAVQAAASAVAVWVPAAVSAPAVLVAAVLAAAVPEPLASAAARAPAWAWVLSDLAPVQPVALARPARADAA
jgi:hypothetical protein